MYSVQWWRAVRRHQTREVPTRWATPPTGCRSPGWWSVSWSSSSPLPSSTALPRPATTAVVRTTTTAAVAIAAATAPTRHTAVVATITEDTATTTRTIINGWSRNAVGISDQDSLILETRTQPTVIGKVMIKYSYAQNSQVDSAFYPPWDGKMSTSQRAVMLCGWGVKAGMV